LLLDSAMVSSGVGEQPASETATSKAIQTRRIMYAILTP